MLLLCTLVYSVILRLAACDRSFTIVLDTTWSMLEEFDVIKGNLPSTLDSSDLTDIGNYIIVPFNDPDVGEPVVKQTPRDFLTSLNSFTADGGKTCPENSLAGIEKALQISKHGSKIFVFTDAFSKDVSKFSSIEYLCRNTNSQVVILLSGFCLPAPGIGVQVFYDVAKACSGTVLRFDAPTLRQAFPFIKEVINVKWTDIINFDTFTEYKQLSFSVDSFTKTMLLVAAGEFTTVQITSPDGSTRSIEKILDSLNTQVIRLVAPQAGEHTAVVRCNGTTSVTLYMQYELPLRFGFSSRVPRNINETSRRPIPGRINYILIDVTQSKIKLEKIEIQKSNVQEKNSLELHDTGSADVYWTETFVELDITFRIWIKGYDTSSYKEIKGVSENFIPQSTDAVIGSTRTSPKCEILEAQSITVDFGKNATIACKVTGYPTPSISWEDNNGNSLPSENVLLEIPSLYVSYGSLENVTKNSTIYCKSKNIEGADSCSLDVFVYRPYTFKVVQTPSDLTIEYGSEGKLYCEVSAYPEAEVKWYHNDNAVIDSDEILPEEHALWIKNMTVNNIGEYKCEITNEANMKTYNVFVNISGIEPPEVKFENENIVLKLGDWSSLECTTIKGKPSPTITWTYKSEDAIDFGSLPDGVDAKDDGKLKIASAQANHNGVFRCTAVNVGGRSNADVTVQLKYPPLISKSEISTLTVKEEEEVVLTCDVKGSPEPRVHWEMAKDNVLMTLDGRHQTDNQHTHRFKALLRDSGTYRCIAENDVGSAESVISVDVQVAPYIQPPKFKTVGLRVGDSVMLPCNVIYGNPAPTTKWKFIALDSTVKDLARSTSTSNSSRPLYLNNVNYSNVGSYLCIADNIIGTDSIQIEVKIQ